MSQTRLRPKNVGIAVKSYRERATDRSGRGWSYEQNQSQQGRRTCSKILSCDYKSQTGLTWSYHQSRVIAPPVVRHCVSSRRTICSSTSDKLCPLVLRPIGNVSHDLHLQWLATIGRTCRRAITNDWSRWRVWPIVGHRPTSRGDQRPIVRSIVTTWDSSRDQS